MQHTGSPASKADRRRIRELPFKKGFQTRSPRAEGTFAESGKRARNRVEFQLEDQQGRSPRSLVKYQA